MSSPAADLRDVPRDFRADEMFFSTTDRRGIITAGNEVFVRISGYAPEELIGRAHNLVRHPDMPRAAFRLVWNYLQASRRAVALVKNRAKDGSHYWVAALFAPIDDGFLSIRFKPGSSWFAPVREIYGRMLAEEKRAKDAGADGRAQMDASTDLLTAAVRTHGFADYDAFMRTLLCDELKSRDALLAREGRTIIRPLPEVLSAAPTDAATVRLRALYEQGTHVYSQLSRLYERLDDFVALQRVLEGKSQFVTNLTRELRLAAMNIALASTQLGDEGQSLAVISHFMGGSSSDVATAVGGLTAGIQGVSGRLRTVIFNLAACRLQIEMLMTFVRELIVAELPAEKIEAQRALIRTLQTAFRRSLDRAAAALGNLDVNARSLNTTSAELERHILSLELAQLGGRVETSRLAQQDGFTAVFTHIRQQIDSTRQQLLELSEALRQLDGLAEETPRAAGEIAGATTRMEENLAGLAAA
jgi:aerotaxis receptor